MSIRFSQQGYPATQHDITFGAASCDEFMRADEAASCLQWRSGNLKSRCRQAVIVIQAIGAITAIHAIQNSRWKAHSMRGKFCGFHSYLRMHR